jgi:ribonuclease BN (tRNA processing enzyme)
VATAKIQTDTAGVDAALSRAKVDRLEAEFVSHSHCDHALDVADVVQRSRAMLYGSASTLNMTKISAHRSPM